MSKSYSYVMVNSAGFLWTFIALGGLNLLALPLKPIIFKRKPVRSWGVIDAN